MNYCPLLSTYTHCLSQIHTKDQQYKLIIFCQLKLSNHPPTTHSWYTFMLSFVFSLKHFLLLQFCCLNCMLKYSHSWSLTFTFSLSLAKNHVCHFHHIFCTDLLKWFTRLCFPPFRKLVHYGLETQKHPLPEWKHFFLSPSLRWPDTIFKLSASARSTSRLTLQLLESRHSSSKADTLITTDFSLPTGLNYNPSQTPLSL